MSRHHSLDRRAFLGCGGLALAGVLAGLDGRAARAQDVRRAPLTPPVPTGAGRIRGFLRDGVNQFYSVPYGAPTGGSARFLPPLPATPWTGVRDCLLVRERPPQDEDGPISEVYALDRREPMGEDCLSLNVFTPALGAGRRPVMVWLHGGGYSGGSGNWLHYDGSNLARGQDVVVVSVTHRLNLFGFLHLADLGGERWARASNAGLLDLVAALQWVRDNIAGFGGDPGNVTIFGQSGGGGKVTALMAMPAARGLFHRAIAQSGSTLRATPRADATRAAEQFLAKLGLSPAQLDRLQQLPWPQLNAAYLSSGVRGLGSGPVLDGQALPHHPWDPSAPAESADVPLLVGSTETEDGWSDPPPPLEMPEADMLTHVRRITQDDEVAARELVALYRRRHPGISTTDVWLIMNADNTRRANVQTLAELKHAQGKAAVYAYFFAWRSPVHKGQMKAYHTLDIPFVFDNVDIAASMTGSGQDRYALAQRMSASWAAFARTGDPNHAGIPHWPVFAPATRSTLIWDNEVRVADDPHREERLALAAVRSRRSAGTGL